MVDDAVPWGRQDMAPKTDLRGSVRATLRPCGGAASGGGCGQGAERGYAFWVSLFRV